MSAPRCPVCSWPAPPTAPACAVCDWQLLSGLVLGPVTPERRAAFERRLAAAQRTADRRAAALAASAEGRFDPVVARRLERLLRSGPGAPQASPWPQIDAVPGAGQARPDSAEGMPDALRDLADSRLAGLVFVQLDAEGAAAVTVDVGPAGLPRLAGPERRQPWHRLLVALPADADECRFLLAGGTGTLGGEPDRLVEAAADLAATLAAPPWRPDGHGLVVVARTAGLPAVDAAVAAARRAGGTVASLVAVADRRPLPEIVADAVRRAPLRYDIGLRGVTVDRDSGVVRPAARTLFHRDMPADDDGARTVTVNVAAHRSAAKQLALPVCVGEPGRPEWTVLRIGRIAVTPGASSQVRVRLDPSGAVGFEAPAGADDEERTWAQLAAAVPPRVPLPQRIDVACLVELGGTARAHADRVARVGAVLDLLAARDDVAPGVRVAVVGYGDHDYGRIHRVDGPFPVQPLGAPAAAVAALSTGLWGAAGERYGAAAPVEDAVARLSTLDWSAPRKVALVFGRRPPHPHTHDRNADLYGCTDQFVWADEVAGARAAGIRFAAAVERRQWREDLADAPAALRRWAEHAWSLLGDGDHLTDPDASSAAELLAAAGLADAAPGRPLPLALVGSHEGTEQPGGDR
ncbi:hypothetical protein [Dactylosporangium darangshiense]|uniref:VWFA domain-containing protein n=1 Tax=Dactylosporangium darangshiense TaxID=579108 RepID=A0ABP8DKU7_9ACTN